MVGDSHCRFICREGKADYRSFLVEQRGGALSARYTIEGLLPQLYLYAFHLDHGLRGSYSNEARTARCCPSA